MLEKKKKSFKNCKSNKIIIITIMSQCTDDLYQLYSKKNNNKQYKQLKN